MWRLDMSDNVAADRVYEKPRLRDKLFPGDAQDEQNETL